MWLPLGGSTSSVGGSSVRLIASIRTAAETAEVLLSKDPDSRLFRTLAADPRRVLTTRQDWAGVTTLELRDGRWAARTDTRSGSGSS